MLKGREGFIITIKIHHLVPGDAKSDSEKRITYTVEKRVNDQRYMLHWWAAKMFS